MSGALKKNILFVFILLAIFTPSSCFSRANFNDTVNCLVSNEHNFASVPITLAMPNVCSNSDRPNPIFKLFKRKQHKAKKLVAAFLAFPFPFGIVGLHRIYLGTKPWVPVVYIASLGGVFGLVPLIDFFVLLFDKDPDRYVENGKVLMWVKD